MSHAIFEHWRHYGNGVFMIAAREVESDDDEPRFKERVGKLVKHKPVEKPE